MPRLKRFVSEVKAGVVPQTLWFHKDVGHTQDAKIALREGYSLTSRIEKIPIPATRIAGA